VHELADELEERLTPMMTRIIIPVEESTEEEEVPPVETITPPRQEEVITIGMIQWKFDGEVPSWLLVWLNTVIYLSLDHSFTVNEVKRKEPS
jgi:hypothetical protein